MQHSNDVIQFPIPVIVPEVFFGSWKQYGNPSPSELARSISTCKRHYLINLQALDGSGCYDEIHIRHNIKILNCYYIQLMDYLLAS
jgi:hypothetical protein